MEINRDSIGWDNSKIDPVVAVIRLRAREAHILRISNPDSKFPLSGMFICISSKNRPLSKVSKHNFAMPCDLLKAS